MEVKFLYGNSIDLPEYGATKGSLLFTHDTLDIFKGRGSYKEFLNLSSINICDDLPLSGFSNILYIDKSQEFHNSYIWENGEYIEMMKSGGSGEVEGIQNIETSIYSLSNPIDEINLDFTDYKTININLKNNIRLLFNPLFSFGNLSRIIYLVIKQSPTTKYTIEFNESFQLICENGNKTIDSPEINTIKVYQFIWQGLYYIFTKNLDIQNNLELLEA